MDEIDQIWENHRKRMARIDEDHKAAMRRIDEDHKKRMKEIDDEYNREMLKILALAIVFAVSIFAIQLIVGF